MVSKICICGHVKGSHEGLGRSVCMSKCLMNECKCKHYIKKSGIDGNDEN